jgi:hypothetical protein
MLIIRTINIDDSNLYSVHIMQLLDFLFFFAALGFELKASHLLGRTTPPTLFCGGFFLYRVSWNYFPGWLRTTILLISAS